MGEYVTTPAADVWMETWTVADTQRAHSEARDRYIQRASQMAQNRAALPKPPWYARRKELLDLLSFDRLPATAVPALSAQLREMGVGCEWCKHYHGETTADNGCSVAPHMPYCGSWEAQE